MGAVCIAVLKLQVPHLNVQGDYYKQSRAVASLPATGVSSKAHYGKMKLDWKHVYN